MGTYLAGTNKHMAPDSYEKLLSGDSHGAQRVGQNGWRFRAFHPAQDYSSVSVAYDGHLDTVLWSGPLE
ncbi:hypothetical protein D3C71_2098530 [compost metagenome]